MADSRPFLGETHDRNKAFPGIDELAIVVVQDKWGNYTRDGQPRESRYTKGDIPRHLPCVNPRCQQGGLDLQAYVMFSSGGEITVWCNGHEGTPKGRRKGDPCENRFDITLTVKRSSPDGAANRR
jgi:hypothetical protein